MAEGLLRRLAGDRFEVESAGTQPAGVHPVTVDVMREIGIDVSPHRSKSVDEFLSRPIDCVITVCDAARENCPVFPGAGSMLHWSFDDPAAAQGPQKERLAVFRRVRDEIAGRIREFIAEKSC
jgi:arsenate reductase